jgi:hypothetical protein
VIAYIIIAFLLFGALYLFGLLVMAKRENQQLQEDLSKAVPLRDYAEPFVPEPWRPADDDARDTPKPPSDPAP